MTAFFEYKGVNSLSLYMRIPNEIAFPSPEVDVSFEPVPGRDGDLTISNDRLKDVPFSIPITIHAPEGVTIEYIATKISEWLKNDIGWFPLKFSGSPEYEYMALFTEHFDVQETLKTYGKTVLNFKLRPYKRRTNAIVETIKQNDILFNREKRIAKPLIKITGNGNITLKNNGKDWLVLESVDGFINVDSETMTVFKPGLAQFNKMKSHLKPLFPVLNPGPNVITWTGNVAKVEILPRWEAVT